MQRERESHGFLKNSADNFILVEKLEDSAEEDKSAENDSQYRDSTPLITTSSSGGKIVNKLF